MFSFFFPMCKHAKIFETTCSNFFQTLEGFPQALFFSSLGKFEKVRNSRLDRSHDHLLWIIRNLLIIQKRSHIVDVKKSTAHIMVNNREITSTFFVCPGRNSQNFQQCWFKWLTTAGRDFFRIIEICSNTSSNNVQMTTLCAEIFRYGILKPREDLQQNTTTSIVFVALIVDIRMPTSYRWWVWERKAHVIWSIVTCQGSTRSELP